ITAIRLEVFPDASLPNKGPGRAENGNLLLSEFELWWGDQQLTLKEAIATHSQENWDISATIDGNRASGWALRPEIGKPNTAYFELKSPLQAGPDGPQNFQIKLKQFHGSSYLIGRFRIATTTSAEPLVSIKPHLKLRDVYEALVLSTADRSEQQRQTIREHFRSTAPETAAVRNQISVAKAEATAIRSKARKVLVSMSQQPREVRVLPRGNWQDDSGEIVTPAIPASLGKLNLADGQRASRIDLANWLAANDNPLTSRIFVNRLWKLLFGRGLVKSLDDFGAQGNLPTHAELLDWLAIDFVQSGWDIKRMVRQMVMSKTYRQSSDTTAEMLGRDPHNLWLARQGRFRLDAELIRDNALAVSGLLVRHVGGQSVRPYQPQGFLVHLNFPPRTYQH
ncbi:MAG: DUF1553 domain-containing protein, partial [Planctomycetales bacterium]